MSVVRNKRIFGLDVIRVAAMLMVVLSHAVWIFGSLFYVTISNFSAYTGVIGVEIFFALSGFLIGTMLIRIVSQETNFRSWILFMVRRWMRTLPAYYFSLILLLVLWPPNEKPIAHLFEYVIFIQNFMVNFPSDNWFNVSWSLAVEEWFYLLFSATMLFVAVVSKVQVIRDLPIGLFLIFSFALRVVHRSDPEWFHSVHQVVLYRLDAIAYGVLLARIPLQRLPDKSWVVTLPLGLLAVFYGWILVSTNLMSVSETWRHIGFYQIESIGCILCVASALSWQDAKGIFSSFIRVLSNQSYSIYLTHMTVIQFLTLGVWNGYISKYVAITLSPLSIFIVSWLIYRFIEKPFLGWRPPQTDSRISRSAST